MTGRGQPKCSTDNLPHVLHHKCKRIYVLKLSQSSPADSCVILRKQTSISPTNSPHQGCDETQYSTFPNYTLALCWYMVLFIAVIFFWLLTTCKHNTRIAISILYVRMVLTISNNSLTSFSDSPRYLEVRVEDETLKKVVPHSVATALANMVFPVPGGPTISTPFHGRRMPCKNKQCIGSKLIEGLGHGHLILYFRN